MTALATGLKPLWEKPLSSAATWLVAQDEGVVAIQQGDASWVRYDAAGVRVESKKLPLLADDDDDDDGEGTAPSRALRMGDAWLGWLEGQSELVRFGRGKPSPMAEGKGNVLAFDTDADGIVVARENSVDLSTLLGKARWSVPSSQPCAVALGDGLVVALEADGALAFLSRQNGETLGTLRLASTEPASAWRVAMPNAETIVLALGDWVVFVDVAARKVLRRVRVRANVRELAADAEWVIVALEDGWVQAIRAGAAEPAASFQADAEGVNALALGPKAVFVAGKRSKLRSWDRATLGASVRTSSPVTAIASRGDLIAVGDKDGRLRVLRGKDELASCALGEPVLSVEIARGDMLICASARVIIRGPRPWKTLRPIVLRTPPSAFAADDAYAFVGTASGSVDVYDLASGNHVTTYALTDGGVTALVRLPGRLLVVGTGALDGRVLVVDVEAAEIIHRLEPHDEAFGVTCLAAEAKGRIVASGGDDGMVVLFDPAKGRILARLEVPETPTSLAFDATGRKIACAFQDGAGAVLSLGRSGAELEDVEVEGASSVVWGSGAMFGLADGRVANVDL